MRFEDMRGKPSSSLKRRFQILQRDDFTCQYCGRRSPEVPLEVDHIIPRSYGGSDKRTNLITSCRDCNLGKGGYPLETGSRWNEVLRITQLVREKEQHINT